ncbi:S9 family peptidase [Amycolatopsis azurea]|uniref:Peptidase n=1 Tax=Amycolatopsis azurea DSM 43854 TaxID=1238180 RepID=M2QJ79_9PSEU|nr:S9 family peptidase [Amycolatopsis azurea]EMD26771.1 peptidase [Amycolatopsis azurea DSM 43854]OOC04504.1 S9 family peptidase [Amycolatopsis azurea DSM 43854]
MTDTSFEDLPFLRRQARTQRFTLGAPKEFKVAPDGSRVLFLRSESGTDARHSLWSFDVASGEETKLVDAAQLLPGEEDLPPEERARRERSRETGGGVVGYAVDDAFTVAAFSLSGKLHTLDLATGEVSVLVEGSVVDPRPSPDGAHVAYVRDRRLRVIDRATGADRLLVEEDGEDIAWGLAEFIAAEEMGRTRGYWWAPDGKSLLVERSDRADVPRWTIADPANPQSAANVVAYPAAGTTNADVTLAILGLDGSRVDVTKTGWEYLAAVHWSAAGKPLLSVQSRDQRTLEIQAVDPADGSVEVLHTETDEHWVELAAGVPAWTADGRLVRESAADGDHRLVVDGVAVTPPGLQVRSILHVGAEVLFSASEADPTQIHVFRTEGGELRRLSTEDGVHVGSGNASLAVLSSWSLDRSGPAVSVVSGDETVARIASHTVDPDVVPNLIWLTLGERGLRAALVLPTGYEESEGKLPVLLDPYGGPHAQRVLQTRNAFLTPQWLADQGFAVLVADGRGTPGRGSAWEKEIAGKLADVTLADQVDALHAAAALRPELDLERVAIRGWSYGGYLSALAVLRRPDVFHAGVAGAPVTDWSLYDTHYTERYLGLPQTDTASYEHNSLIAGAGDLSRALLIVHGLADDNVFVAHSLRLSSALLAKGRPHVFLPLAGATHMTPQAEEVAENLMRTQVDWIVRELSGDAVKSEENA